MNLILFVFPLTRLLVSGCKTKNSFCFSQDFFEVFFEKIFSVFLTQYLNELPCFAGGKGKSLFYFSQIFFDFFSNLSQSQSAVLYSQ